MKSLYCCWFSWDLLVNLPVLSVILQANANDIFFNTEKREKNRCYSHRRETRKADEYLLQLYLHARWLLYLGSQQLFRIKFQMYANRDSPYLGWWAANNREYVLLLKWDSSFSFLQGVSFLQVISIKTLFQQRKTFFSFTLYFALFVLSNSHFFRKCGEKRRGKKNYSNGERPALKVKINILQQPVAYFSRSPNTMCFLPQALLHSGNPLHRWVKTNQNYCIQKQNKSSHFHV